MGEYEALGTAEQLCIHSSMMVVFKNTIGWELLLKASQLKSAARFKRR